MNLWAIVFPCLMYIVSIGAHLSSLRTDGGVVLD